MGVGGDEGKKRVFFSLHCLPNSFRSNSRERTDVNQAEREKKGSSGCLGLISLGNIWGEAPGASGELYRKRLKAKHQV